MKIWYKWMTDWMSEQMCEHMRIKTMSKWMKESLGSTNVFVLYMNNWMIGELLNLLFQFVNVCVEIWKNTFAVLCLVVSAQKSAARLITWS